MPRERDPKKEVDWGLVQIWPWPQFITRMPNEELQQELEALQCTYGDDLAIEEQGDLVCLRTCVRPIGNEAEGFIEADVAIQVPADYPAAPPALALKAPKGLGDARLRELQQAVADEVAALHGEPGVSRKGRGPGCLQHQGEATALWQDGCTYCSSMASAVPLLTQN